MNFEFHPEALEEFQNASLWYEEQRYQLGLEFGETIGIAIQSIMSDPERFQPFRDGVRIFRLKRFPYYLFYRISTEGNLIRILAVTHHRQQPGYWMQRR